MSIFCDVLSQKPRIQNVTFNFYLIVTGRKILLYISTVPDCYEKMGVKRGNINKLLNNSSKLISFEWCPNQKLWPVQLHDI